jgi:hypothetical protein
MHPQVGRDLCGRRVDTSVYQQLSSAQRALLGAGSRTLKA